VLFGLMATRLNKHYYYYYYSNHIIQQSYKEIHVKNWTPYW